MKTLTVIALMTVFAVGVAMIVLEAEARSEDEPTCYSQSCKKAQEEKGETLTDEEVESSERVKEDLALELNASIVTTKEKILETEAKLVELVTAIGEYEMDMYASDTAIQPFYNKLNSFKHEVTAAKKAYKTAFEAAESTEDFENAKLLRDEYDAKVLEYELMELEYGVIQSTAVTDEQTYWDKKSELAETKEYLELLKEEVRDLDFDLKMAHRNHQFIVIEISRVCQILEKMAYEDPDFIHKGTCLKYSDLIHLDNTDQSISGEIYDAGWDLQRKKSLYTEYWKYYEQIPNWKIITVIPNDAEIYKKATVITVQAHQVKYVKPPGSKSPTSVQGSINQDLNERYVWTDIYVDRYCTKVSVSPDIRFVELALQQVMKECKDPYESYIPKRTLNIWPDWIAPLPSWMDNILVDVEEIIEEIIPEEPEGVVCYSQACKTAFTERGIPVIDP